MNYTFNVMNPWCQGTDVQHMSKVTIEELPDPIYTKTGKWGKGIKVTISCKKYPSLEGLAVCVPQDEYSLTYGTKLAMKRALAQAKVTKPTRTALWKALLDVLRVV